MRWLLTLCALPVAAFPAFAQEKPPPNVVFIMADDLNTRLGCYGHSQVRSPNIDRLAQRGVRFERAYCQYPVCNPSRTSLLSGRRPGTTGVVDNLTPPRTRLGDARFLPQYFRTLGYFTIKVGKIFHTGDAFEDPASWDVDIRETKDAKNPPKETILRRQGYQGIVLKTKDEDAYDGKIARQAVQLLEKAAQAKKPFFLAVGFRRPHSPYIAPQKYFDMYPPEKIEMRGELPDHVKQIPKIAFTFAPGKPPVKDEATRRATTAAYYASISYMDAQVGVLLDALDRLKLWDNTVVVFVSDHGYHLGEHGGFWHKMSLFEESARVPLIVSAPGKKGGVSSPRLVELIDVYPTLVDLCRLKPAPEVEGKSFTPLLDDPMQKWKPAAFTVVSRGGGLTATMKLDPTTISYAVRTERYRLMEWHDGSVQLYDHDDDPYEETNLAFSPQHAQVVRELRALFKTVTKR